MLRGHITRSEWRWALLAAALVAAVTCLPYLYAHVAAPPGLTFRGLLINAQDGNTYLAKMRQGYEGMWLYRLAFSPEDQKGLLVYTLYLGLGHVARITGLSLVVLYHVTRAAGAVALLLATYALTASLTPRVGARRWAFWIVAFGSGLGLVSQLGGRAIPGFVPIDFYIPEANAFYSMLTNPHFPLTAALEALTVLWIVRPPFSRQPLVLQCLPLAAAGLGIASMAPYLTPVIGLAVMAGLTAISTPDRQTLVRAGVLGGGVALAAYEFVELRTDPAFQEWSRQNQAMSPPILDTVLGLGIWLPLAFAGAWQVRKAREPHIRAVVTSLLVWIFLTLVLMYVPFALQRRFVGGVFVPVAVLAGVGTHAMLASTAGPRRLLALAVVLVFGFSSNALITAVTFTAPRQADATMYLTDDEVAALDWLDPRVTPDDVVLADVRLGTFVPGWTGGRSVYGHQIETSDAARKRAEVLAYYQAEPNRALLDRYRVKYVIGGAMPPNWRLVFESGAVRVYSR